VKPRSLSAEDLRAWTIVTATVRPLRPVRATPSAREVSPPEPAAPKAKPPAPVRATAPAPRRHAPPEAIEPGRRRRLVSGREAIAGRVDLHGLDQDRARSRLAGFIASAARDGWRSVLVITGKGAGGDGVLRRRVPEWLGERGLREHVAGYSEAHRRHGGEGAYYVALRRG
jgi:DNA-nicking Smr family endonuclease